MNLIQSSSDLIRILHVDDDENQLIMMRELLRIFDPHMEFDSVSNPLEVPEKLRNKWYDCLVIDYQMPKMTGIELSMKIRKENKIPIILYTGKGSEEVAEMAFSVGINDYFRKEVNSQHIQVLAKKIRDVVDKQRMEQIYTSVVKEARNSIVIAVGDKIVFANQAFVELTGASSVKDVLSKNLNQIIIVEKKLLQDERAGLKQGEKTYTITESEIKRKDGKRIPVEINLSIIEYLGEKAFLFFLRDITKQKTFETEIKNSEVRYRTLLELAPDGIITINLRGNVTWINPAYTSITGFAEEDIVGKKIWSIEAVRAPDIKTFLRLFYDQVKGKSIPPVESQWVSKDGKLGWAEGRASLIKIDNKKTEVLLILRDITIRKKMEKDLKAYSMEMEHLAAERAHKLLDSEKMIAAGAIASTVAHDLRGPLSAIRNAVYIFDKDPEKSTEMKQIINKAVDNAVQMLNDIQEKTATESLQVEDINVVAFIESVINETPIPSRITVKTDLREATVSFDRLKIRRVIENLIRNAVDAMPEKGNLYISNKIDADKVVIEVKDTGEGIPDDVLKGLFKPFHTTKVTGTGLGLYYCRNTLEAHEGSIEVKSKVGSGTTVILSIPMKYVGTDELIATVISHQVEPPLSTLN